MKASTNSEPTRPETKALILKLSTARLTFLPGKRTRCSLFAFALHGCLLTALAAEVASPTPSAPQPMQPIPWSQRTLFIPYQLNKQAPASSEIAKVQLLISRTGANDWVVLQSAQPNVQGFSYHAPEDGSYWFALRHLDANGKTLDGPTTVPQLHLVINTQLGPAFNASTSPSTTEPVSSTPAQSAMVGTGSPFAPGNPFQTTAKPALDWPASNQLPTAIPSMTPVVDIPPASNSYTAANDANIRRTPARFAVDDIGKLSRKNKEDFASNSLDDKSASQEQPTQLAPISDPEWSSAGPQTGPMLVNARTFDVEYDLQAVGSWGVAKVELWGTQDEGATWQSFGIDPDNHSPIRVTVPNSGTFGFRILVVGANSLGVQPPQAGDKPELVVMVDLDQPRAKIVAIESGSGNLADQLRIRWSAEDENLEPRPIGLFYSSYAEGPWTTIATGLENSGSYVWRIERHIPGRLFLKLEVRDTAGNVATYQTPEPVELTRPQPTGTLRRIRPVADEPVVEKN